MRDGAAPAGPGTRGRRRHAAWGVAAAVLLAAVFASYLDPHLMRDLAARAWSCF